MRLIETDKFDFEFLSRLAERESWRKEIHRPVYYLHKWWAKRLGSVFRGILLGSLLPEKENLPDNFYSSLSFPNTNVFDPFMGSGVTVGEAHKLGLTALGRDINPVVAESTRIAFGPMDKKRINHELEVLKKTVGQKILKLYRSLDTKGSPCDVLYYFWIMQAECLKCFKSIDLFSSRIIAKNVYSNLKPIAQILCPDCGNIFPGVKDSEKIICSTCHSTFSPNAGNVDRSKAKCHSCHYIFPIISAFGKNKKPKFRLYGKLVLTKEGKKEYLKSTKKDLTGFNKAEECLRKEIKEGLIDLPTLKLKNGYNTNQAINYGFESWRDFFNDRQLLGLGWLHRAITNITDKSIRDLFLLSFSSALEFNNIFTSYKGEGTGAVRHIFSHHILKPERTPIEANIWGTAKSSGSFFTLFQNRVKRATIYRQEPKEINVAKGAKTLTCSPAFSGKVSVNWPTKKLLSPGKIYLSCGDSSKTRLPDKAIDLIVTDPPFFDNVHYSELADFFYSWQQLAPRGFISRSGTTRCPDKEAQDRDPVNFTKKLHSVFCECHRVLKDNGLFIFTYHHSKKEGWQSVAKAVLKSGFFVVNSHPVKSEMSVATPKSQAKNPIQLDSIIICRKNKFKPKRQGLEGVIQTAEEKINRLKTSGFSLSENDKKLVKYGQLLTYLNSEEEIALLPSFLEEQTPDKPAQLSL